jgi:solute carrier family 25 uncoupling protein 8/9
MSSVDMYKSIYRERGILGLWVGLLPNMARNSVVNATELVSYDTFKELLIKNKLLNNGLTCHFTAGFAAGFMATIIASPIDVVKTRVMNSTDGASFIKCAKELALREGFLGFYKGIVFSFIH